ncbi:hypothetical protein PHYBOEH_009539 [Phytophthora boehmeriae]|uniref:Transglutaminase elicitor n=1 Tax=Phytophthora boehmeriae TaxID=109152 RepID=A0A8T1X0W6_9STRA|nr:hypothetical protein PHYBOEH_009539 [Phytophthora boehmeriae]
MVYTPRKYLIPAAVALVALQARQAAATSLYYDPVTSSGTTDEISSKFPARGADVADQDCSITVEVDPTLPDITTISDVPVTYADLLANTTTAPSEPLSNKVGTAVISEDCPSSDQNQDAYATQGSTSQDQTIPSAPTSKTGTTVSQTTTTPASTTAAPSSKTGITSAPSTSSTGSDVEGSSDSTPASTTATPSTKTGVTPAPSSPSTGSDVEGSSDTTPSPATVTPSKTGVTSAPAATTAAPSTETDATPAPSTPSTGSDVEGSSDSTPAATTPSKTGTTVTAAPASTPSAKTGVTPAPSTPSTGSAVEGSSDSEEPNCATGWEDQSARKLRGRKLQEKVEKKRRLEANTNKDIAKLEAYFGTSMVTTLSELPTVGVHTPSPWPGPYWPTYQDGINVIWSPGEPSAAEKYATAFGLDVTDFMDKVSADNGVDSQSSRTKCSSDSDCSSLTDGSSCAIRTGKTSGYCIPSWFGICHAWAPAAILEEEPKCPVTYNGVTFQPMDLKALISDVYDGATVSTVFTGTRYNGGTDSTDEYGRHSSDSYRDLNPAYFHIAAANILGNLNSTFVADVTAGSEVWNQPVRGFKVYEQTEMSLEEAAQTFYGLESYPWNAAAKSIVYVKTRLSWIFETYTDGGLVSSGQVDKYTTGAYYYYLLEMDDAGAIIGGEWVYGSDDDHPDFLWFGKAKPAADTVTSIGLSYADVSMLLEKSVACEGSSSGSESVGSSASASSSASSSASASASASASTAASTSGSAVTGSSSSEVPVTSSSGSAASSTGSFTESTDAPTETPAATTAGTGSSAVTSAPASTTAPTSAPASTTAAPSSNNNNGNNGNNYNHDSDDNSQQQQQQSGHHWWSSWFHWW